MVSYDDLMHIEWCKEHVDTDKFNMCAFYNHKREIFMPLFEDELKEVIPYGLWAEN